jgi:hypothetical protein
VLERAASKIDHVKSRKTLGGKPAIALGLILCTVLSACRNREAPGANTSPSVATKSTPTPAATPPEEAQEGTASDDPVVAAAGDIACAPTDKDYRDGAGTRGACRQRVTSEIVRKMDPDAVLALGDLQYEHGEYENFMASYHPTWGRFQSITWPAPGNHEYRGPTAPGYFQYWGERAGAPDRGYYSFDLGQWHILSLNSNCTKVGGCRRGSVQQQWLEEDLRSHNAKCTLAYWHHPLFSSGSHHGPHPGLRPIWRTLAEEGADVVLSGHEHLYERFAPQTEDGEADAAKGIRQFTVGTGGKSLYGFAAPVPNSELRGGGVFGVLKLNLLPDSYAWEFIAEAGKTFTDKGSESCR